jgi:hypothetical protein
MNDFFGQRYLKFREGLSLFEGNWIVFEFIKRNEMAFSITSNITCLSHVEQHSLPSINLINSNVSGQLHLHQAYYAH